MSGCVVSNKLIRNRALSCLSMLFLAVTLMLTPEAEAQDALSFGEEMVPNQMYEAGVAIEDWELPPASGGQRRFDVSPVAGGAGSDV